MWWGAAGLVMGLVLGFVLPLDLPLVYARYLSVAVLAAVDAVLGGARAALDGEFEGWVFVTGLLGNSLIAAALTYVGDRLGVELYYAAVFALGYRIFQNLGRIRRQLLPRWPVKKVSGQAGPSAGGGGGRGWAGGT
ncbi:MAG: small basic family protein [Acetobacteraceae bacterium]|nr:small basic family protein [Acetobacteraceae bacterium]